MVVRSTTGDREPIVSVDVGSRRPRSGSRNERQPSPGSPGKGRRTLVIKRIPIRVKLAGALAVPLLLVVSVAYVEIANATQNVDDVKDETDLATTTVGPGGLILALQNER